MGQINFASYHESCKSNATIQLVQNLSFDLFDCNKAANSRTTRYSSHQQELKTRKENNNQPSPLMTQYWNIFSWEHLNTGLRIVSQVNWPACQGSENLSQRWVLLSTLLCDISRLCGPEPVRPFRCKRT